MKKHIIFVISSLMLLAFIANNKKKITIFLAGDSTMSIKDSRAFPETGWGMPFVNFWDSTVTVVNMAKNGRSTKTFLNEGLWDSIIFKALPGDYIIIQFGHNDEVKEKVERFTTPDTFKINLRRLINEAKEKKAIPVLLTPVSRRKFDSAGNALQTHPYSSFVREIAKEEKVLFIDLDEKSRALYQQFGAEQSKLLFLQLYPAEHPNYPEGREDNTHFNELGARLIAELVLKELKGLNTELNDHIYVPPNK